MQKIKIIILFVVSWVGLSAQDPHFSVFYGVPIGINPAYTGNFNANFRISAQYRDQWNSVLTSEAISAYRTSVASFEARTNKGIDENDFVGMGAYFMYDIAGQSRLSNTKVGLSAAYRKSLDQYGDHFIAIGGQVASTQKRINTKDLTWGTQWDGTQYDGSLYSESGRLDDNLVFYDFSTGISWGYNKFGTRNRFFAGLGLLHINQPQESFFRTGSPSSTTARLPMRINFNAGAGLQVASAFDIMPKFIYMKQGQNMETMLGADLRMLLDPSDENTNSVYFGMLTRVVGGSSDVLNGKSLNFESFVATARVDYNNFEVGAAYDVNVSDLTVATKYQGGFEIYLNYMFRISNNRQKRLFCPKF